MLDLLFGPGHYLNQCWLVKRLPVFFFSFFKVVRHNILMYSLKAKCTCLLVTCTLGLDVTLGTKGPWKSTGAFIKFYLGAQWTHENWGTCILWCVSMEGLQICLWPLKIHMVLPGAPGPLYKMSTESPERDYQPCSLRILWDIYSEVSLKWSVVHYNMIMHTSLLSPRQNTNRGLHSQKTTHTSPSQVSYGVSIVSSFEKIDHIIYNGTTLCSRMHKKRLTHHGLVTPYGVHFRKFRSGWALDLDEISLAKCKAVLSPTDTKSESIWGYIGGNIEFSAMFTCCCLDIRDPSKKSLKIFFHKQQVSLNMLNNYDDWSGIM